MTETTRLSDGTIHEHHSSHVCEGPCPLHSPTEHHMSEWPIRVDPGVRYSRVCPDCSVAVPDPDWLSWLSRPAGAAVVTCECSVAT